jgi:predicted transcriptional regulator
MKNKFSIALDPETLEKLSELAEKKDRSVGYLIRAAIDEYLKKTQEPQK